jgi:hypothetical protein
MVESVTESLSKGSEPKHLANGYESTTDLSLFHAFVRRCAARRFCEHGSLVIWTPPEALMLRIERAAADCVVRKPLDSVAPQSGHQESQNRRNYNCGDLRNQLL